MDNLFRLVFNNKFIRNNIFKYITIINKDFIVKKYNRCNIKWIIKNHHYNLLLYKFQKEIKKRKEFTDDLFCKFLESNDNLEILKEILKLFPQFLPTTSWNSNQLIEHCSRLKKSTSTLGSLKIIKYLVNELGIKVTIRSINSACSANNCEIVRYYLGINENEEDRYRGGDEFNIKDHSDIGTLFCSIRGKDFELFQLIFDKKPSVIEQCQDINKFLHSIIKTDDVRFITHYCNEFYRFKQGNLHYPQLKYKIIEKSSIKIIKYLASFSGGGETLYYNMLFMSIPQRKNQLERMEILKFFIEDFKIYEKVGIHAKTNIINDFCQIGDLDCITYLHGILSSPGYTDEIGGIIITTSAMDLAISSRNFHVFYWLLENSYVGCSIRGLTYLCKNISTLKDILDKVLNKFSGVLSPDMILQSMYSTNRICHNKENFDYLASFLPDHLIPTFPIETSIENYDY
ncbi:hypothetical protein RB653_009985 [Dictyostelium firmibasis]|uniref:Ankyrin repeat protein n=1 Tax=Dictyostelium firmibasis TaxID=79012 RepID=A0AAN7YTD3_9MYCE